MAKRQLNIYLQDIVESIELIERFVSGVSLPAFEANIEKQDAVIRRLAIIGEAAKHIPEDFRTEYPEVPWRKAAGLRDVVVHEYFGVSLEIIWGVVDWELPELKKQMLRILEEMPEE